jgi:thymidylate synthase
MTRDFEDADGSWIRDLEYVFKYGTRVSPRGMNCYETLALQSKINMNNPIIFNKRRELGYKFMAAEAAWILSGYNDVATISQYSKDISKFSDDGETFFGAYGPKIHEQLDATIATLHNDIHTRQAVINIWRENPPPTKDVPCTLSLQFLVRDNTMHCVASMRSSDLWLGHPYDIFNFSAVAFYIGMRVGDLNGDKPLKLGYLHLTAGSKHIYERNAEAVGQIIEEGPNSPIDREPCFVAERYDSADDFIDHLWECANRPGGAFGLMMK